jgi:AAHS family 4-hydroxybenzoate transporter-like MFS transporter
LSHAAETDSLAVDVSAILDAARFGAVQSTVLAFTFFALVMDGFDIQAIAFAAPALTRVWTIERSALGPVFAAALFGMVIGAAGIGLIGDRYGRKLALILSSALVGLGSLASALARSPIELAALRLLTGIGLGGVLPNATALMFEFAPKAWRQIATAAALVGVLMGGMVGAGLAKSLIPHFGWQALFVVGGIIPALLACVMLPALPESPRYLAGRQAGAAKLAELLNRICATDRYTANSRFALASLGDAGPSSVAAIFARGYLRDTLTLWVIFFTNVFSVYFFFNWLPTVLAAAKLDFGLAVTGSLVFNLGGVLGALVGSALITRAGSKGVLAGFGAGSVASVIAIAANPVFSAYHVSGGMPLLIWSMAAAGCCINALQIGMFSVAAHAYPTFCRSTGVGWSLAIARFGGILSAFAGASFFALGLTDRNFFLVIASMLAFALLGVLALRRHIPATTRETIP